MIKLLEKCYQEHRAVSLYLDTEDTSKHLTGYIGAIGRSEVLIHHISCHGLYDGYIIIQIASIFRICWDGKYENKIEKLYQKKDQKHEIYSIQKGSILYSSLSFAKSRGFVVFVGLLDNSVTGVLKEFNEEVIYMTEINEFGEYDGVSKIQINEINTISFDTDDEQDILILMDEKYK